MAMIPAITTGIMDFIISSGLITDMAAIPVPDFAVPYAAPRAIMEKRKINQKLKQHKQFFYLFLFFVNSSMHVRALGR